MVQRALLTRFGSFEISWIIGEIGLTKLFLFLTSVVGVLDFEAYNSNS